ncbi:Uncharacterized protein DBV15_03819, partial [Temnothorax longispinosus]
MQNVNSVLFERNGIGDESEQLTLKAVFYRGHRSFAPLRYFAVSCPIILASDARRVKRDSKLNVRNGGDERNPKDGAPLRCKPATVSEDEEQWGPDKGVRGRLRDGEENRRDGCSGFPVEPWTRDAEEKGWLRVELEGWLIETKGPRLRRILRSCEMREIADERGDLNGGTPSIRNKKYPRIPSKVW